jgi:hypothetical protein
LFTIGGTLSGTACIPVGTDPGYHPSN